MTYIPKRREIILILFLFFFIIDSCTRPGDNAIKPLHQTISQPTDSLIVSHNNYIPKIYTIEISGMKFHPEIITIHKGDTVTWKNNDLVTHCVTQLPTNAWTSSKIPAGASWSIVINTGCDYFCAIHLVMKGKIIVE